MDFHSGSFGNLSCTHNVGSQVVFFLENLSRWSTCTSASCQNSIIVFRAAMSGFVKLKDGMRAAVNLYKHNRSRAIMRGIQ